MNPFHHPGEKMFNIYKSKMKHEREQNAILFMKLSIRVLRNEFGFSPEMISDFTKAFQKELEKHDRN
jgi:hypothetical protein